MKIISLAALLIIATLFAGYSQESGTNQSTNATSTEIIGKPKFFDSDRLMTMLAQVGITAQYGGELIVRGDLAGGDAHELVNVLEINVKKPLTSEEAQAASSVAVKFFSSPGDWHLSWHYGAIGIKAGDGDGRIKIVPLHYSQ